LRSIHVKLSRVIFKFLCRW